jgi:hypothetical protein
MSWAAVAIIVLAIALVALFLAWTAGRAYVRYRGARLVECPENEQVAAVQVDAVRAAAGAPFGKAGLQLSACTRWPERRGCGEECLRQIEAAPEGCLVRTIVADWYKGKACVVCGTPLDGINWYERRPALMGPDGRTAQWPEVPPDRLPEVLATHKPLCWNCHVAESFRRQHPELVVDNPWKVTDPTVSR